VRDLAFVALLAILVIAALSLYGLTRWLHHGIRQDVAGAKWKVFEISHSGITKVTLELTTSSGEVLDQREIGTIHDDDPNYDDRLLTLRAIAQQRLAVVATR
jgi:hypothetical protein